MPFLGLSHDKAISQCNVTVAHGVPCHAASAACQTASGWFGAAAMPPCAEHPTSRQGVAVPTQIRLRAEPAAERDGHQFIAHRRPRRDLNYVKIAFKSYCSTPTRSDKLVPGENLLHR